MWRVAGPDWLHPSLHQPATWSQASQRRRASKEREIHYHERPCLAADLHITGLALFLVLCPSLESIDLSACNLDHIFSAVVIVPLNELIDFVTVSVTDTSSRSKDNSSLRRSVALASAPGGPGAIVLLPLASTAPPSTTRPASRAITVIELQELASHTRSAQSACRPGTR